MGRNPIVPIINVDQLINQQEHERTPVYFFMHVMCLNFGIHACILRQRAVLALDNMLHYSCNVTIIYIACDLSHQ